MQMVQQQAAQHYMQQQANFAPQTQQQQFAKQKQAAMAAGMFQPHMMQPVFQVPGFQGPVPITIVHQPPMQGMESGYGPMQSSRGGAREEFPMLYAEHVTRR